MLQGIHHAGITVASLERALSFYRGVLGLEVFMQMERTDPSIGAIIGYPGAGLKIAFCGVPGDAARVELLEYMTPAGEPLRAETSQPGSGHVCFRVDGIDALHARLVEAGFPPRSTAPVTITEGANAGARALYVRDPDGYTVELFEPSPPRRP